MKTPVSFSNAKLIREKVGTELFSGNMAGFTMNKPEVINLPTIAEIVMWLYEKHGVWINVTSDYNRFNTWEYRITSKNRTIGKDGIIYNEGLNSPTEAYEAAIEYVLKNLVL